MSVRLQDSTALVTGATGGIGQAIVRALHARGAKVIATGRKGDVLEALAQDLPGVEVLVADLADAGQVASLLTGRDIDAAEAERIGLAAHVVADAAFAEAVRDYASRLAAGPPVAQSLTKRLLSRSLDTALDAALRDELVYIKQCFATADVAEAIAAFREKRLPTFRGV